MGLSSIEVKGRWIGIGGEPLTQARLKELAHSGQCRKGEIGVLAPNGGRALSKNSFGGLRLPGVIREREAAAQTFKESVALSVKSWPPGRLKTDVETYLGNCGGKVDLGELRKVYLTSEESSDDDKATRKRSQDTLAWFKGELHEKATDFHDHHGANETVQFKRDVEMIVNKLSGELDIYATDLESHTANHSPCQRALCKALTDAAEALRKELVEWKQQCEEQRKAGSGLPPLGELWRRLKGLAETLDRLEGFPRNLEPESGKKLESDKKPNVPAVLTGPTPKQALAHKQLLAALLTHQRDGADVPLGVGEITALQAEFNGLPGFTWLKGVAGQKWDDFEALDPGPTYLQVRVFYEHVLELPGFSGGKKEEAVQPDDKQIQTHRELMWKVADARDEIRRGKSDGPEMRALRDKTDRLMEADLLPRFKKEIGQVRDLLKGDLSDPGVGTQLDKAFVRLKELPGYKAQQDRRDYLKKLEELALRERKALDEWWQDHQLQNPGGQPSTHDATQRIKDSIRAISKEVPEGDTPKEHRIGQDLRTALRNLSRDWGDVNRSDQHSDAEKIDAMNAWLKQLCADLNESLVTSS